MILRSKSALSPDGRPGKALLEGCMAQHARSRARFEALRAYYGGRHEILARRAEHALAPNNRLVAGFPKYISDVATGYCFGQPIVYQSESQDLRGFQAALRSIRADTHDARLGKKISIYGEAYELLYVNADKAPGDFGLGVAAIDPTEAFVVYDSTAAREPLFGVYYIPQYAVDGTRTSYTIYVYTNSEVLEYAAESQFDLGPLIAAEPNYFGLCPLIEYRNNEEGSGDFEHVMSYVNAYNLLQSDRLNDKERFVQALLLIKGATFGEDDDGAENFDKMLKNGVLSLPQDNASVEYLTKNLNENEVEVLRAALSSDIHKFSQTPDFSDEHFAGQASGVALKFKLWSLENLARVKHSFFAAGLKYRLALLARILYLREGANIDPNKIQIITNRTLPVDELEVAQTIAAYAKSGTVSEETLLTQVPFVGDPAAEMERMKREALQK